MATELAPVNEASATGETINIREFDLIVVGAGSGNSIIGPEFDTKSVALIDDGMWFGGTCLNAGCIPTKMFVRVADVATDAREATRLGLTATIEPVDWLRIRDRVFAKTDKISNAGFRYRNDKSPNVTVYRETFVFEDEHTLVATNGSRIRGAVIVIAAGSRPRALPTTFPHDPAIHNSDTIMRIDALPATLAILGGGAISVEFAHVFSALGVQVTVIARAPRLLNSLDRDVADRFTELAADRWTLELGSTVRSIEREGDALTLDLSTGRQITAEMVLVAEGRIPNADRLGATGVGFDLEPDGRLVVDTFQRVHSRGQVVDGVFALGDVSSAWQLKHVANHQARVVGHNIAHPDDLIGGDPGPVPAAIFSHPQIAHFGITQTDADALGGDFVIVTQEYRTTAYGWALEDVTSFCKLIVDRSAGTILGAHIIGPEASILIQPLILAASHGMSIRGLARSLYWPHPAASEVVENALLKAEGEL